MRATLGTFSITKTQGLFEWSWGIYASGYSVSPADRNGDLKWYTTKAGARRAALRVARECHIQLEDRDE